MRDEGELAKEAWSWGVCGDCWVGSEYFAIYSGSPLVRYAYVDLATSEQQAMAVKLSERMLEGRRLLIKLGGSSSHP